MQVQLIVMQYKFQLNLQEVVNFCRIRFVVVILSKH